MNAHEVTKVRFRDDELLMVVDGQERAFPLADVSPSGYGIHWPLLDEDLSIDGLLCITHRPTLAKRRAAEQRASRAQATP